MSACTGKCCAVFNWQASLEEMAERVEKWRSHPNTSQQMHDDVMISAMLIPLTAEEAVERAEQFDVTPPEGMTLESWAALGKTYTCKHWNPITMLCGAYEDRPMMCRDYPYDKPCQHDCNCTYRPDDVVQEFWRKIHTKNDESPAD